MALGCMLTQFDRFVFLAMMVMITSLSLGRNVTNNQKGPSQLNNVAPGPNPSIGFSRTGATAGRGDKSPFKQVHRKIAATAVLLPQICYQG